MTVLVTGAGGFLGRAVVAALASRGHAVRAGVRRLPDGAAWPAGVQPVLCDVGSGAGLAEACAGAEAVIHLAAAMGGSPQQQEAVAVDGTRRLVGLMDPSARLLLASSFAVYDWRRVGDALDEHSPLLDDSAPGLDPYARAKLRQERLARALCAERGIGLTVLRPALIWSSQRRDLSCLGPGTARARLVLDPGRPLRLVHVDSCASAFAAALDPRAIGHTFNVDDASGITARDYAAACGVRLRLPVPVGLAAPLAAAAGRLLTPLVGADRLPGLLAPGRLRARFHPARAGHAALHRLLGWEAPPVSFRFS